jgi:hypothetical protein
MSSRTKLLLVILVLTSPLFASYMAFYFWKPTRSVNYGELLPTKLLLLEDLQNVGGASLEGVKGKWVLLTVDSGNCDALCGEKLYLMRQVRMAQGKDMNRVARALVVDDRTLPNVEAMKSYEGTIVLKGGVRVVNQLYSTGGARSHIFLIDPLGNLVLRYPANPDPKRMIKDLMRLLSVSSLG